MEMPTWVLQLLGHTVTLVGVFGFYYWKARDADRNRFARIDERFDQIDEKFQKMDEKFEERFDKIDEKFDKIDEKFDKVNARINEVASKVDMVWGHLGLTGKADRQT